VVVYFQLDGISEAWVKVGGKTVKVRPGANAVIKSGRWPLYWRKTESDRWRSIGKRDFAEGKEWVVRVGAQGPKVRQFRR
jgi:hypothetical protein